MGPLFRLVKALRKRSASEWGEASDIVGYLVYLVLEEDYAESPFQGPPLQFVDVLHRLQPQAAVDVAADAVVGSHAGPHRRHLVGHVDEVLRLDAGDGLLLGRRLHLEDADGVGLVKHGVDRRVFEVDAGEVQGGPVTGFDGSQGVLHLGKSADGQEVYLDEAGLLDGVLVPLHDVAPLDGAGLDGHDVGQRAGAYDHASRVLGKASREAVQLPGKLD